GLAEGGGTSHQGPDEPERLQGRLGADEKPEMRAIGSGDAMQDEPAQRRDGNLAVGIAEEPRIDAAFRDDFVRISAELVQDRVNAIAWRLFFFDAGRISPIQSSARIALV